MYERVRQTDVPPDYCISDARTRCRLVTYSGITSYFHSLKVVQAPSGELQAAAGDGRPNNNQGTAALGFALVDFSPPSGLKGSRASN